MAGASGEWRVGGRGLPVETYTLTASDFEHLLDRPPASDRVRSAAHARAGELARAAPDD